jgi:homoserine dehydrogenase
MTTTGTATVATTAADDAYCTTGSSPGGGARGENLKRGDACCDAPVRKGNEAAAASCVHRNPTDRNAEAALESFGQPTISAADELPVRVRVPAPVRTAVRTTPVSIHLLGPGAVGCALLRALPRGCIVTGVTDSTATVRGRAGLDPFWIAANKACGRSVGTQPGARALPLEVALDWVGADVVIDATATDFDRPAWADALEDCVLARGRALALAAKDALCRRAHAWLADGRAGAVGCNAVLGGTGRSLRRERADLRERCCALAIAGNASTTTIVQAIERGGTLADGIAEAGRRGFLEADPELDLRGEDAAVKLAIVTGALRGRPFDPAAIPCEDVRDLDPALVRARAARGRTTRLVARADEDGRLAVRYQELTRGSALAVPCGRVAYAYTLEDGTQRVHIGAGLGAVATARALAADVAAFAAAKRATWTVAGGVR